LTAYLTLRPMSATPCRVRDGKVKSVRNRQGTRRTLEPVMISDLDTLLTHFRWN
jgi:hypothetical protein